MNLVTRVIEARIRHTFSTRKCEATMRGDNARRKCVTKKRHTFSRRKCVTHHVNSRRKCESIMRLAISRRHLDNSLSEMIVKCKDKVSPVRSPQQLRSALLWSRNLRPCTQCIPQVSQEINCKVNRLRNTKHSDRGSISQNNKES